ncbi:MFS transporter [Streptomyces sp. GC420]|uniref:MFS transporter n=1 Tax=Streptomyces sp. GC420 TaxID=2697568 RepID=UPI001414F737|nr:MFS transporter [Streptomyces sp. GC420]NBM18355.1 MFS transporter [Streptomyces sp. GC420]
MSRLRGIGVLVAIILPTFMTALDNTVVNVALPQIRSELSLGDASLKWVAAIYPLALSGLLLVGGHLADSRGRRPTLLLGISLFSVASLLCALSSSGAALIAFRGLQGTGAALIMPASLSVLFHDLPPRARNGGVSALTAALASSLAFGPVFSGLITEHLGWNWLFAVNAPLGALCLLVAAAAIPRPAARRGGPGGQALSPGVPPRALALSCIALGGLAYCLIEGPHHGFASPRVAIAGILALASVLMIGIGAAPGRRAPARTVGVLLRGRAFAGGLVAQLLWGLGVSGVYFFTSQFLQNHLELSPTAAGLTFTPVASALLLTAPLVAVMARRWGDGRVSATGLLLVSAGLLLVAAGSAGGGIAGLVPGLTTIGVGSALAIPLTTRALESSPGHLSGVAAGLFSATREASGVLGIAVVGVIVTFAQHSAASAGADSGEAFVEGYRAGLYTAAGLVAVGVPVALWALRRRPGLRGGRPSPPPGAPRAADEGRTVDEARPGQPGDTGRT